MAIIAVNLVFYRNFTFFHKSENNIKVKNKEILTISSASEEWRDKHVPTAASKQNNQMTYHALY